MNLKEITDIALTVGEILLSNGSENHRIETSINKICESYGIKNEVILTSNGILLLVEDSELNKYTSIRKVKDKCVDLYKIELINSFSRKITENPMTYEEAREYEKNVGISLLFGIGEDAKAEIKKYRESCKDLPNNVLDIWEPEPEPIDTDRVYESKEIDESVLGDFDL